MVLIFRARVVYIELFNRFKVGVEMDKYLRHWREPMNLEERRPEQAP